MHRTRPRTSLLVWKHIRLWMFLYMNFYLIIKVLISQRRNAACFFIIREKSMTSTLTATQTNPSWDGSLSIVGCGTSQALCRRSSRTNMQNSSPTEPRKAKRRGRPGHRHRPTSRCNNF